MDNHRPIATDAVAGGGSDSASAGAAFLSPIPPPRPSFIPLFTSPSPHRPPPPPPPLPSPATDEIHHNGHALTPSDDEDDPSTSKKQKTLASLASPSDAAPSAAAASKKPKKKSTNVWNTTSRKGKKKTKPPTPLPAATPTQDQVLITPVPKLPDKSDDTPDAAICLSRFYKADKVELSDDRLTAGSGLGFRMVRATRGVGDGAWYFEIRILRLGPTGHVRLGWTTGKGDLQAPVGYDANSFGYRDVDGSKLHKATREAYGGEGYGEGDVIGFYINLPDGLMYAPKPPQLVLYKGQRYMYAADGKDDPPKVIPGSEMSFYKNGVCQGVAFTDLFGGRYYPAASMYTMPHQLNCEVRFNFGPEFEFFPQEFGSRPTPRPMIEVPYQGSDGRVEAPVENGFHTEKASSSSAFKSV